MPYCSIIQCKNESQTKNLSKGGVSYHRFPQDSKSKKRWINATGRQDWVPTKNSTVCSEHFLADDFSIKKLGRRFLKNDAVPTQKIYGFHNCKNCLTSPDDMTNAKSCNSQNRHEPASSAALPTVVAPTRCLFTPAHQLLQLTATDGVKIEYTNAETEICRMCLRSDLELHKMQKYDLEQYYLQLTGVTPHASPALPQAVCVCCAHLLRKFHKLRRSALLANDTLQNLIREHGRVSKEFVSSTHTKDCSSLRSLKLGRCVLSSSSYVTKDVDENNSDPIADDPIKMEFLEFPVDSHVEDGTKPDESFCSNDAEDVCYSETDNNAAATTVVVLDAKIKKPAKRRLKSREWYLKLRSHFTIKEYTPEEQRDNVLRRQLTNNYRLNPHKCLVCYRGYVSRDTLELHMLRHTDVMLYGDEVCPACGMRYKSAHQLRRHTICFHEAEFSCVRSDCSFVTSNRNLAARHLSCHQGVKYACPHCDASYDKRTSYLSHVRIFHPSSDHVCQLCGYSFIGLKGLFMHKMRRHPNTELEIPADAPTCDLCDIKFVSEDALRTHQRVSPKHQGPEVKKFRNQADRPKFKGLSAEDGGVKRDPETSISRELCPARLPHGRPRGKRRAMCELCGRMFQSASHLRYHRDAHSLAHRCPRCPRAFPSPAALAQHAAAHRPPRAAACPQCGKTLRRGGNLNRHLLGPSTRSRSTLAHALSLPQLHRSERAYPCQECDKRFANRHDRAEHHKHKHLGVPYRRKTGARGGKRPAVSRAADTVLSEEGNVQASVTRDVM